MKMTEFEKACMMEVLLENLKEGGQGILIGEDEYQWMLNELINDGERYEDCALLRNNKEKIVGDVSTTE